MTQPYTRLLNKLIKNVPIRRRKMLKMDTWTNSWLTLWKVLAISTIMMRPGVCKADSVDDYINTQMPKNHITGLSLAIIDGGTIVRAQGYGFADTAAGTAVTQHTLFQAGSISKSVAAMGALRLVESGKLSLDADVNSALVSWKVPENQFTNEKPVTLRAILSHTAGLSVHGFAGYAVDAPVPTLLQIMNGEKPANTPAIRVNKLPGSIWRYSGGGYMVMQQMVLDVTGTKFPGFMRDNVLTPLGMTDSSYEQPMPPVRESSAVNGYSPDGSLLKRAMARLS